MFFWFHQIERSLKELAGLIPLELFVVIGSFTEEVVAFIPSMAVMTTAGFFAHLEHRTPLFLIWLVLLGNLAKLGGSWIYYMLGDKLEDVVVGKCGRFLGLSHTDIEGVGRRFNGNWWRDAGILAFIRAIPFIPTTIVSIASGVIKLPLKAYLLGSYVGNFCKDLFYAISGYYGARALKSFFVDIERVRFGVGTLTVILIVAGILFLYIHRHKGVRFFEYVCSCFGGKKKK